MRRCSTSSSSAIPSPQPKALNLIHTRSQHVIRKLLLICLESVKPIFLPKPLKSPPPRRRPLLLACTAPMSITVRPPTQSVPFRAIMSLCLRCSEGRADQRAQCLLPLSSWPKSSQAPRRGCLPFRGHADHFFFSDVGAIENPDLWLDAAFDSIPDQLICLSDDFPVRFLDGRRPRSVAMGCHVYSFRPIGSRRYAQSDMLLLRYHTHFIRSRRQCDVCSARGGGRRRPGRAPSFLQRRFPGVAGSIIRPVWG